MSLRFYFLVAMWADSFPLIGEAIYWRFAGFSVDSSRRMTLLGTK